MLSRSTQRRLSARAGIALFSVGTALLVGACGTTSALPTTTTTTSTTLPSPVEVLSTQPIGSAAFEGPIFRIAVPLLANGSNTLPVRPITQRTNAGTVKIAYRQFGSGPNLVLAMGEHGSMSWWDPTFLNTLSQSYRVTIFDVPAVGYSAGLTRAPSVETDGDLMAGLIASLGLNNVTILGWGMGGEVALSLAERHPKIAIALVLADASAGGPASVRPSAVASSVIGNASSTMVRLSRVMYPSTPAGEKARLAWLTNIANVAADDVLFSTVTAQAAAQNAFFRDDRVARLLSTITVPTWIFQGAQDEVIPKQNAELLATSIPSAQITLDADVGYAGIFQDSATFLNGLSTFFSRVTKVTTTTSGQ